MAEVLLSADEQQQISAIVEELMGVVDDFFVDARPALSGDEWTVLTEYAGARMRRLLEVGKSLHAVVDAHGGGSPPYSGRGREAFVSQALGAWRDSFSPIKDPWRLALFFHKIPGGEQRLLADASTLETMAANRLYSSLDAECERLLAES